MKLTTFILTLCGSLANAVIHIVMIDGAGAQLTFTPNKFDAKLGDTVEFTSDGEVFPL